MVFIFSEKISMTNITTKKFTFCYFFTAVHLSTNFIFLLGNMWIFLKVGNYLERQVLVCLDKFVKDSQMHCDFDYALLYDKKQLLDETIKLYGNN